MSGIGHLLTNSATAATYLRDQAEGQARVLVHDLRGTLGPAPQHGAPAEGDQLHAALHRIEHKLARDARNSGITVLLLLWSLVAMVGYLVVDAVLRGQ
jgi:hypothetical protein